MFPSSPEPADISAGNYLLCPSGHCRYVKAAGPKFVTIAFYRGGPGERVSRRCVDRWVHAGKYVVLTKEQYDEWMHSPKWARLGADTETNDRICAQFIASL